MALSALMSHLLRRAGLGIGVEEQARFSRLTYPAAVDALTTFDVASSDIDAAIGTPGYVGITTRGVFSPNTVINDSRQRWLFRLVHSPAPLQERMSLFWHHHFATAYSKIAGVVENSQGARMMAAKASEDAGGVRGQIELFRQYALGNFRELLLEVAKDPAMVVWLDGQLNKKAKPQENFGRELMELFTFGVETYVENDVYAAARVFTGWNLSTVGARDTPQFHYVFNYNANEHDTAAKDFSFPVYANGNKRIEARAASGGMQDGIDLISALAIHPETARRLARRLWTWFISETESAPEEFVSNIASVYLENDTNMRPVIRAVLFSPHFTNSARYYARYAWPVEHVVRSLKEVGFLGFSVDSAITPLLNMGQQLYEPPDVNGWELGPGWFSTGGMLARMNFASVLASNQKFALREAARKSNGSPDALLDSVLTSLSIAPPNADSRAALINYVNAGGVWTGSDAQLLTKAAGLVHLLTGSGDYQFV